MTHELSIDLILYIGQEINESEECPLPNRNAYNILNPCFILYKLTNLEEAGTLLCLFLITYTVR